MIPSESISSLIGIRFDLIVFNRNKRVICLMHHVLAMDTIEIRL